MALKVYNTLTRKLEEFKPLSDKKVKMFVCGQTVSNYAHIGHAKTYIAMDVVAKYLRYRGYDVFYLQNVTDIDDRMIEESKKQNLPVDKLAEKYLRVYLDDMKSLRVDSVNEYAKATDFIPQIIEQIKGLMEKGYAYEIKDGIYFDVSKFKGYGKLAHLTGEEVRKHRIEPNPNKRNPEDFALWKKQKPGEPAWDSPFGKGRPGWHIEDTAITIDRFGPQYDLHGGGEDLIFPHHEDEIAQAEAFTGKEPFVKYWLHVKFLKVEGRKMSKSLHNFITIPEAIKDHGAELVRFFFATTPYYKPLDYSKDSIASARASLEKIKNTIDNLGFRLKKLSEEEKVRELREKVSVIKTEEVPENEKINILPYKEAFIKAMDNNFNTTKAMVVIFDLVRDVNKLMESLSRESIEEILNFFKEVGDVLGLDFVPKEKIEVPKEVMELVWEREGARREKNWKKADELRAQIKAKGYWVSDTPKGPKIEKIGD